MHCMSVHVWVCNKLLSFRDNCEVLILSSISVTAPIDKTAEINYALVDDPTFTDTYILSRNKARVQQPTVYK